ITQVELAQALAAALETVRPLAQTMAVTLQANLEGIAGQVFTDEGIFRQLLIQALSLGIQHAATGKVRLKAVPAGTVVNINIEFARGQSPVDPSMMAPLRQLAGTLNLLCIIDESAEHEVLISLSVPLKQPRSILVVEDSAAATQLYRRYLEPSGDWRVIAVPEPRLAYDMARSIQPALIILDILMPSTDGWTILNLLHAHEDTASIPVIVCSVFQDVLLAKSLGAKAHLRKPVSQVQLLSAVRTWARQTDNPHAH
ncbi:MAG: response regulator, partial [Anaerolineae bacterium]